MQKPAPPIPDDVSTYFFMRMYADLFAEDGGEWYDFKSLDNLPPYSCKYDLDPDASISFKHPPGTGEFSVIELPLMAALQTMEDAHRFFLNPARWNRVIRDYCSGWCYYPWMTVLPGGQPVLQDGRHRIVTMMKLLGMTSAPFVVEHRHLADIMAWPEFKLTATESEACQQ